MPSTAYGGPRDLTITNLDGGRKVVASAISVVTTGAVTVTPTSDTTPVCNSTNWLPAVLSRLETKLDSALNQQEEQQKQIGKLWGAVQRIDVRVALIAGGVSAVVAIIKTLF